MPYFNIIAESKESTVVTEYTPVEKNAKSYQTEAQLEAEFIRMLQSQGYEYLQIHRYRWTAEADNDFYSLSGNV